MLRRACLAGLVFTLLAAAAFSATPPVPELTGRVSDHAGVLSEATHRRLERELADFEAETRHQLALLTVASLGEESIETFSLRVVEAWKLGHEDFDNGVLLVVAPAERAVRIEVGYGLEGVIPDALASRILRERVLPRFRAGRLEAGIEAGLRALMTAARGETLPPPPRGGASGKERAAPIAPLLFAGLLGGSLALPFSRRRRRLRGALIGAMLAGLLGWLLLPGLAWIAGAAGLGGVIGSSAVPAGPGHRRRGGGFYSGGFGGGYGGGFGGGFSGGGGRFGGGGASGSW